MDSMDKYYNMSMVDVAYELMSKKKSAVNFFKLWEEVCQMKKFDDEQKEDKESLFYTNITLDGRFITVGENAWDLRSRHKFSDVHIDMNDIYADEEETEELEEDVDSTIEDDYGVGSHKRYKKDSYIWYQNVIKSNGLKLE